ncbi:phenylalanine--tRNA ligase, alpha subunit [Peptoanaerobacter stomatis]|uniref:Phenylalanine--tRNA ligase alpha subunit n=1 Tax=Peptoanaerobacter stomatis TaxID=796937 RepID=J6HMF9_9FIRM|nr:phenylalanine--tRNA ligase, alpha subunit [Peptoanaerobacter stomatis]NWO24599.1 phenylalanine--tRNA ligase subunit alpha [Peptostreptococcaceae bacterium oral taxon 081]
MKEQLQKIKEEFIKEMEKSRDKLSLENIRLKYLGKKGELTAILKQMGKLSSEERPLMGKLANEVREEIEKRLEEFAKALKQIELEEKLKSEFIDVTMPVKPRFTGSLHPLSTVTSQMEDTFMSMGFSVVEGPEVDTIENNFDALNAPKYHPSRDMTDTFYLNNDLLLRTQTSTVQIRTMKTQKPPIRMISPGRCFRCDTPDATHSPMFHQLEGLVIDKGITFANLKYTLEEFVRRFFGDDITVKFRPHNFPFTEPSAEVDVLCFKCKGHGCPTCKGEGFIEILGAGMVHPNVLRNCNIDPEIYSGFAFGMGIDRITMMKYEIEDIRYMYENDMRFLKQF